MSRSYCEKIRYPLIQLEAVLTRGDSTCVDPLTRCVVIPSCARTSFGNALRGALRNT